MPKSVEIRKEKREVPAPPLWVPVTIASSAKGLWEEREHLLNEKLTEHRYFPFVSQDCWLSLSRPNGPPINSPLTGGVGVGRVRVILYIRGRGCSSYRLGIKISDLLEMMISTITLLRITETRNILSTGTCALFNLLTIFNYWLWKAGLST